MNFEKYKPFYTWFPQKCLESLPINGQDDINEAVKTGAIAFFLHDDNINGDGEIYPLYLSDILLIRYGELIKDSFSQNKRVLFGWGGHPRNAIDIKPNVNLEGIKYLEKMMGAMELLD